MLKAIVFDFGNVLYDLNLDLFYLNMAALLEIDPREPLPDTLLDAVAQYHKGDINTETFIWRIQKYKNGQINPRSIINCWNSILDQFPPHRWSFLEEIKKDYKLFLLSNINELHLDVVYKQIKNVHGKLDFETDYFEAVFYSHLINMIKPEPEIYRFVERITGLVGEELLFIDDKSENVKGALDAGWNAVQHDPKTDIASKMNEYLKPYL